MIPLPTKPKIIKSQNHSAVIEIEGLYPGYGVTVGNTLRRVLLSSLEGAAITEVKIKDVSHEFSTLSGVLEDVIVVLLNLKKLSFQLFAEEPQTATLQVKGEKEVKGKDFKLSSQLKLSNPDQHIATLTKSSAELNIEAKVEKGIGFSAKESREKEKAEVGVILLDAVFTPVKKINFRVENMRVGKRTDFDKLIMEIETDGTVKPEDALSQSAKILLDHFSLLAASEEPAKLAVETAKPAAAKKETKAKGKVKKEPAKGDSKKMKIEDLAVSERTKNGLINNNIKTISGLLRKSVKNLSQLEGLGQKSIEEIQKALKKLGLELK